MNLSQRAWNNVIIFAMLLMVYLFSISNKFIVANDDDEKLRFLLPEHSIIMSIEFADVTLQRIGRSWRTEGSDNWLMENLQSIVYTWQHAVVSDNEYVVQTHPYVVTMQLAGEEKQRVFLLSPYNEGVLINSDGKSAYLANSSLGDLVPQ